MKTRKKKLPADSALNYPVKPEAQSASYPTHDAIAARAYWIWVEAGYPVGRDLENWLQAERELLLAGPADMPREPKDLEEDDQLKNPAEREIDQIVEPVNPERRSATSL